MLQMSQSPLAKELGAILIVGVFSALVHFGLYWNNMWIWVYLRHWVMSFGYYVEDGVLLSVLTFIEGVSAFLVALLGLRLLVKRPYSIRRGLIYGFAVGLLGVVLSAAVIIAYIYSLGVDLPTTTSEHFRLVGPQSISSALYWVLVSIPLEWTSLIGASIGGLLSAIWKRSTATSPTQNTKSRKLTRQTKSPQGNRTRVELPMNP